MLASLRRCATTASLLVIVYAWAAPTTPASATPSDGTVIGATKIVDHGAASERYNLVLVAEGYRAGEQALFAARAQDYVDYLFATPPFDAAASAFDVWRVDVASTESGADEPAACFGGSVSMVDTYFDATFCSSGLQRLLTVDDAGVISVVSSLVPEWDQILVIVNSSTYGGSGGSVAATSVASNWQNVAVHEFGHSGFGLADEYEYYYGCGFDIDRDHHPAYEPTEPNVTTETDPALLKWAHLVAPGTLLPTTVNGDCSQCDPQPDPTPGQTVVGLYEGAHYYHCDAFRPAFDCMMRDFLAFCPVCSERIRQVLQPYGLPCGNGAIDAGEQCDDGNVADGDCCSSTCQLEPAGSPCSAAAACGRYACDGASSCVLSPGPVAGCRSAPKTSLKIKDASGNGRKLQWQWKNGDATAQADLGAPSATTSYALCLYEVTGTEPLLRTSLALSPSALWKDKSPRGWKYKDRAAAQSGLRMLHLIPGDTGRSRVKLDARGPGVPLPTPAAGGEPIEPGTTTVVQLQSSEGTCWTSAFDAPSRNVAGVYKAKGAAACGDFTVQPPETCDGTDDAACPGLCRADCTCP